MGHRRSPPKRPRRARQERRAGPMVGRGTGEHRRDITFPRPLSSRSNVKNQRAQTAMVARCKYVKGQRSRHADSGGSQFMASRCLGLRHTRSGSFPFLFFLDRRLSPTSILHSYIPIAALIVLIALRQRRTSTRTFCPIDGQGDRLAGVISTHAKVRAILIKRAAGDLPIALHLEFGSEQRTAMSDMHRRRQLPLGART